MKMKKDKIKYLMILLCVLPLFLMDAAAQEICEEHSFVYVSENATCTQNGYQGWQCTICHQTKDFESVTKLGHDWNSWSIEQLPDCRNAGLQTRLCKRCGREESQELEKLAHLYETWVQKPTCGRDGYTLHSCLNCGHEEKTDRVERLGHDLVVLVVDPTCTQDGYTKYQCSRCTYTRKENLLEKTGHLFERGTIVKEAGLNQEGKIRYVCMNCDHTRTDVIPAWDNPFTDVEKSAYYRDSIIWAFHCGITTGTDESHFSPDQACTRGQMVTFLWRMAGSPAVGKGSNPFSDVKEGDYYYDAVLWAVQKGITKGVDAHRFAPQTGCTRCQVVTMLHRYQNAPSVAGENPFADVAQDDYFAMSVLWAYKEKITTGVDAHHFSPHLPCTRGQIVTFLFRFQDS